MREAIEQFLEALREEEFYCEEAEEWQFRDGTACAICTCSARIVARRFRGLVYGYQAHRNPTARIGLPTIDGHDFALIEQRWLVDYWAWRVEGLIATPIFDLKNRADHLDVHRLYGDAGRWSLVHSFIGHGQERQLDTRAAHTRIQPVQPDPIRDDPHGQPEAAGASKVARALCGCSVLQAGQLC